VAAAKVVATHHGTARSRHSSHITLLSGAQRFDQLSIIISLSDRTRIDYV
jgi:hypothetical protein